MAADKAHERKERLARALKQNLKRRKTPVAKADEHTDAEMQAGEQLGPGSGIAPQQGPKTASKRN